MHKGHKHTDLFGNPIEEPAPDLASYITREMEQYREHVQAFTVEQLHRIRNSLGFEFKRGNKDALVSATVGFLSLLKREGQFQEWFASLPPYLSLAIEEATFKGYIDVERVEAASGTPVVKRPRYHYSSYVEVSPDLRLGMFDLYSEYGRLLLFMKPMFRTIFGSLLPVPQAYYVMPASEQEVTGWSAEETLSESLPLLLKSLGQLFADNTTHEKILRRGLSKTDRKELRKSSAFPPFPLGAAAGVDPIELIARFIMIDPDQPALASRTDVQEFVRRLVNAFFVIPESGTIKSHYLLVDSSFEFSALCPHLKRARGSRHYDSPFHPHPPARSIVYQIFKAIAQTVHWYDVNEIAESIQMQALPFTIFRHSFGAFEVLLRGTELHLPDGVLEIDHWQDGFMPDSYLTHHLLTVPLLKGYCYLLASLGLLEIEEREPEKRLLRRGAPRPISPFEALARIRITPFGAWCLGTSTEKPTLREVRYEAIADRELPLVTYRGRSLECMVFLQRIGDSIGEDRFRVTEASFIRDCTSPADIEHRIAEFRRLITDQPADHWEALFSRVLERARLFEHEEPCVMLQLPKDDELRRAFVEDKKLSSLVVRAEGGRIVIRQEDYKKLRKALENYGVLKG